MMSTNSRGFPEPYRVFIFNGKNQPEVARIREAMGMPS